MEAMGKNSSGWSTTSNFSSRRTPLSVTSTSTGTMRARCGPMTPPTAGARSLVMVPTSRPAVPSLNEL